MFFTATPRPDVEDAAAAAALARVSDYLATCPEVAPDSRGYRLFWARGDEVGHRDLTAADHAILGRHTACDIPLPGAAELSLRHLLVATTVLADGTCALRVLDLRASLPFYTDDAQPRRSIVAAGPVVLRLGSYLFGGVPIEPGTTRPHLPAELPRAIVTSSLPPAPLGGRTGPVASPGDEPSTMAADEGDFFDSGLPTAASAASPLDTAATLSPFLSRVMVVPPTALLSEIVPQPLATEPPSSTRPGTPRTTPTFARLTLLREGHAASIDLPTSDLDAGVLIGRSERCTDGGLRRVLDGNISRIHVLLLRDGDHMLAFDLCSTQGTYVDGASVRRHALSSAGGCLSLAKTNPVMLCFHPRTASATTPSLRDTPREPAP